MSRKVRAMGFDDGLKASREIDAAADKHKDEIAAKMRAMENEFARWRAIGSDIEAECDPAPRLN